VHNLFSISRKILFPKRKILSISLAALCSYLLTIKTTMNLCKILLVIFKRQYGWHLKPKTHCLHITFMCWIKLCKVIQLLFIAWFSYHKKEVFSILFPWFCFLDFWCLQSYLLLFKKYGWNLKPEIHCFYTTFICQIQWCKLWIHCYQITIMYMFSPFFLTHSLIISSSRS